MVHDLNILYLFLKLKIFYLVEIIEINTVNIVIIYFIFSIYFKIEIFILSNQGNKCYFAGVAEAFKCACRVDQGLKKYYSL